MNEVMTVLKQEKVFEKEFNVYGTFEEPIFLAKDVANMIEHSQADVMIKSIDEDEKVLNNVQTLGGIQKTWFLTEDGLYEVLMQSRKPIAKEFKKEVKKILKEIRTTGAYQVRPKMPTKPPKPITPTIKMYKGQQVVTLRDMEAILGITRGAIRWYIRGENSVFEENKDYYMIDKEELNQYKIDNDELGKLACSLIIVTKSGGEKFKNIFNVDELLKLFEQIMIKPKAEIVEKAKIEPVREPKQYGGSI